MSGARTPKGVPVTIEGTVHLVTGAQVAIVANRRVLVQLRPWPPGWELPGGHIGHGETAAACAVREAEEETGLEVAMRGLVGVYRWRGLRSDADAVFLVEPVGGRVRRSVEALAVRWVDPATLPRAIFPWCPVRIADALAVLDGAAPVVRSQPVTPSNVLFFGSAWAAVVVDGVRRLRRRLRTRGARR